MAVAASGGVPARIDLNSSRVSIFKRDEHEAPDLNRVRQLGMGGAIIPGVAAALTTASVNLGTISMNKHNTTQAPLLSVRTTSTRTAIIVGLLAAEATALKPYAKIPRDGATGVVQGAGAAALVATATQGLRWTGTATAAPHIVGGKAGIVGGLAATQVGAFSSYAKEPKTPVEGLSQAALVGSMSGTGALGLKWAGRPQTKPHILGLKAAGIAAIGLGQLSTVKPHYRSTDDPGPGIVRGGVLGTIMGASALGAAVIASPAILRGRPALRTAGMAVFFTSLGATGGAIIGGASAMGIGKDKPADKAPDADEKADKKGGAKCEQ